MLTTTRLSARLCAAEGVASQSLRKKFTKGDVIKRIMREEKQCFGALLETKKEKMRRLRDESSSGAAATANNTIGNNVDSELQWVMRVSKGRLRKIYMTSKVENADNDVTGKKILPDIPVRSVKKTGGSEGPVELEKSYVKFIRRSCKPETPKPCASRPAISAQPLSLVSQRYKIVKRVSQGRVIWLKTSSGSTRNVSSVKVATMTLGDTAKVEGVSKGPEVTDTAPEARKITEAVSQSLKVTDIASEGRVDTTTTSKDVKTSGKASKVCKVVKKAIKGQGIATAVGQSREVAEYVSDGHRVAEASPQSLDTIQRRSQGHKDMETTFQAKRMDTKQPDVKITEHIFPKDANEQDTWSESEILSIPVEDDPKYLTLPSVTRILNATMPAESRKRLELWMERMIAGMGVEAFNQYKKDLLEQGKLFHESIDCMLRKLPFDVPIELQPCLKSVASVVSEMEHVRAIESHVVHRKLGYRGILDCVAVFRGKLCLIDWKKSDRSRYNLRSTYDAPLQIASYIGALNGDKNYPFQVKSGVLVIASTAGDLPTVHELHETKLEFYWTQWVKRLQKYRQMRGT